MPMETADILAIMAGIGGIQGVIELVKWWRGRKVHDRFIDAKLPIEWYSNTIR